MARFNWRKWGKVGAGIAGGPMTWGAVPHIWAGENAKEGYGDAAKGARRLGNEQQGYYGGLADKGRAAGERALGFYGPAQNYLRSYELNRPTYMADLYRKYSNAGPNFNSTRLLDDPYGNKPGPMAGLAANRKSVTNYRDWYGQNAGRMDQASDVETRYGQTKYQAGPSGMSEYLQRYKSGGDGWSDRLRERGTMGNPLKDYAEQRKMEARQAIFMPEIDQLRSMRQRTDEATSRARTLANEQSEAGGYFRKMMPAVQEKGAAEKFYDEQLGNLNSANDYFAKKMQEDLDRRAAATGGYASGLAQRQYGEQLQGLRAKQWLEMGGLARSAQEMQLARQGQGGDFARLADTSRMERERYFGDAARSGDEVEMDKLNRALHGRLGMENIKTQRLGQADEAAYRSANFLLENQRALDALTQGRENQYFGAASATDDVDLRNRERLDRLADASTRSGLDRFRTAGDAAYRASDEAERDRDYEYDVTMGLSGEQRQQADFRARVSELADRLGLDRDRLLAQMAGGASDEQSGYFRDLITGGLNLGSGQAGTLKGFEGMALDLESEGGRQRFQAQMQALAIELAKAGIDAKTVENIINTYTSMAETAASYKKAG